MPIGLYIHVPFCKRKCPYCDFYSQSVTPNTEIQYVDALIRNIHKYKNTEVDSIYFGGGTPSVLSDLSFQRIFSAINNNFRLIEPEISLEANPCSIDLKKLEFFRNVGFNRISFGVQSCVDSELKRLGRLHNFQQAKSAILNAKIAGFENISADLMIGIPEQTSESLSVSLAELSKLPLAHISAYMLKIEKSTPFNTESIINILPDEDCVADLYLQTINELEKNSFEQYEISNFSKKKYECRHNLKYWRCEKYIGLGPSAHSFFNGKRYEVPRSLGDFVSNEFQTEVVNEEHPHTFDEVAMLRLRLAEGLSRNVCEEFNINFEGIIKKAEPLKKAGLVDISDDRVVITKKGFLVSNSIIGEIIY